MATSLSEDRVQSLMTAFLEETSQVNRSLWRRMAIVAELYRVGESAALHRLAVVSGYAYHTLRGWVTQYGHYSDLDRRRFAHLSPDMFRYAWSFASWFAPGQPESVYTYWLEYLDAHPMSREAWRAVAWARRDAVRLQTTPTTQTREAILRERVAQAEAAYATLSGLVATFNQTYAPYYLKRVRLAEEPYSPAI